MSSPPLSASSTISQGIEDEIKHRLAPPADALSRETFVMTPYADLHRAIVEARAVSIASTARLDLLRVPGPLRPLARLFYRATRLAIAPYLSRQSDFNHHVLVALDLMAQELDRRGRK